MRKKTAFHSVARMASHKDNVAIATQMIEEGTQLVGNNSVLQIPHTVLVGHRFAVRPIQQGEFLLSWGQAFGRATRKIEAGEYVCNRAVLQELQYRNTQVAMPIEANFHDEIPPFIFDARNFKAAKYLPGYTEHKAFSGYRRSNNRGTGTRNSIALLGTSALTGGFVEQLASHFRSITDDYTSIDNVIALAHTEGGHTNPNNRNLVLRTLAGWFVHPNVGAILAVDYGNDGITNAMLETFMREHNYPFEDVIHHFVSLSGNFVSDMQNAREIVHAWIPKVNQIERSSRPLSELKIALQCGGSDAFSGISGNPLAASVAKEIIRFGGSANLAETDELIGAEAYMLQNVSSIEVAQDFINTLRRFQEWAGWHRHSIEGNPSGGNIYRGLYNIYLKSMGAAAKRDPDIPLDYVIDYSQRMTKPGFYFMDSPGNDLESIAGQVAAGCNMIFFVTGNGSITNFPFVPTIKIMTTTERYHLLSNEMDVNAGAYLDGSALDNLTGEMLELTIGIASGQLSAGERAQHAQVQIWRDWQQNEPSPHTHTMKAPENIEGRAIKIELKSDVPVPAPGTIEMWKTPTGYGVKPLGLIVPTSLCSGQIARLCVEHLNQLELGLEFATLLHTEGCGSASVTAMTDTLLNYLQHPQVYIALLLEHGCEKSHNAYMRNSMREYGLNPDDYGWASIQLDGGLQAVMSKIEAWFTAQTSINEIRRVGRVGSDAVQVAVLSQHETSVPAHIAQLFAVAVQMIVKAGGTVILPENDPFLGSDAFQKLLVNGSYPTLRYGHRPVAPGFHVMTMPTRQWGEILTGLGASGAGVMLASMGAQALPAHPFIPVLQVSHNSKWQNKFDLIIPENRNRLDALRDAMIQVLSGNLEPLQLKHRNTIFQITRGSYGISL